MDFNSISHVLNKPSMLIISSSSCLDEALKLVKVGVIPFVSMIAAQKRKIESHPRFFALLVKFNK